MRYQALPTKSLHNPFFNRFHDPVTQRRDEFQLAENVVWLREDAERKHQSSPVWGHVGPVLAEAFALLLVLLVSVSMFKAF
jgi:hypothetical protein